MSISIHSPHQLIGAVPALLGFQPEESIVILGLRDKGVLWVLRTDVDLSPDEVIKRPLVSPVKRRPGISQQFSLSAVRRNALLGGRPNQLRDLGPHSDAGELGPNGVND